jgi:MarR family 2-MHQ and catechol resistance regulon transcriptional repressor
MAAGRQKARREVLRLRRSLARAEQVLADLDRQLLAPDGLCTSDLDILERLVRKGTRPVNGLARRVGLTSGSMTTAVQRLKRRGLVRTRRDLKDKRVVFVAVSADGQILARRLTERRAGMLADAFAVWTDRERTVLLNLLKRLRRNVSARGGPVAKT